MAIVAKKSNLGGNKLTYVEGGNIGKIMESKNSYFKRPSTLSIGCIVFPIFYMAGLLYSLFKRKIISIIVQYWSI